LRKCSLFYPLVVLFCAVVPWTTMQFSKVALLMSLTASTALAATLKIGDLAQGSEFTQCIKVTDFNTKSLGDEVEVTDRVDGCCPEGYIPGIKHYKNYWGAMVICGFKDDGSIKLSTSTSNDVKTCEYNKCYVVKMTVTCADKSMMTLDGCCPKDQYTADCLKYVKSASFFKEKVGYCLSYQKKYKLEGTSETTDDQVTVDGKTSLSLTNLKAYTVCPGGWGGGGSGSTAAAPAPAPEPAPAPSGSSSAPAGGTSKLSCNVGTATTYSGCGSGMTDVDTFAETACVGGDKCLTLQYSAEGGGCTAAAAVGYCVTSATTCEFYDKTYKGQDAYKDYACSECDTDNCNTMEVAGGDAATTSSAVRVAGGTIAILSALAMA